MRVWWIPLVIVLLLMTSSVAARGGEPLREDNNVLWVQYTNDPACCDLWMGTVEADPAFTGSGRYGSQAYIPGVAGPSSFDYPMEPALAAPVTLRDGESATATIYIGSGSPTVGQVELTSRLLLGGTVVAEGVGDAMFAGTAFTEAVIDMPLTVTVLEPAAGGLVWSIELTDGASGDVRICHIEECGHTNLVLPVVGGAAPAGGAAEEGMTFSFMDVEGPVFDERITSAQTSSLVQVYNWSAPAMDGVRWAIDATVEEGLAAGAVYDPVGKEILLFERNVTDALEATVATSYEAGVWTMVLGGENLTGDVHLRVEAAPAGSEEPEPSGTPDGPGSGLDEEATEEDSEPMEQEPATSEKESPALPVLAVYAVLVAAAARSRR